MPRRHRMSLAQYREWRALHYRNGDPRDELGWLMRKMLATRSGVIAMLRVDRREAKVGRPQHTPPAIKDADYLHRAYGRRHGHGR